MSESSSEPRLSIVNGPEIQPNLESIRTLAELILHTAESSPDVYAAFVDHSGKETRLTYKVLVEEAMRVLGGLQAEGLKAGDAVIFQLDHTREIITAFWACILGGIIPVPVVTAPRYEKGNAHVAKLLGAREMLGQCPLLVSDELVEAIREMDPGGNGNSGVRVIGYGGVAACRENGLIHPADPEDVGVIFLTSGSTGMPKGVPLRHRNMLTKIRGTIQLNGFNSGDCALNWMSLDHAGSLVFLGALPAFLGAPQVHVPIRYILQDPFRWFDLIEEHHASISWAPNFVFGLFLEKADRLKERDWDLSSMRFMVNSGEAVVSRTAKAFLELAKPTGLPSTAMRPAFGMVETCSGIVWSSGLVADSLTGDESFVCLGRCNPGAAMRIVDEAGKVVPEGVQGQFQLKGKAVFSGYYNNPTANEGLFTEDGWMNTGDLAYIQDGELYITGRFKDVIIVNGLNFFSHEIEGVVESVEGVSPSYAAAVGIRPEQSQTDKLVIFIHTDEMDANVRQEMARKIRAKVNRAIGLDSHAIVWLRREDFPKTAIGKIQRRQLREQYIKGDLPCEVLFENKQNRRKKREIRRVSSARELAPAIAAIWQDALEVDHVGYDETFFELGGHSLLVIEVQQKLQELIGRDIPITELFNHATVRALAGHFAKDFEEIALPSGDAVRARDLSGSAIAVIGVACRFPGAPDKDSFWKVLEEGRETITFFTREESLREGIDGAWMDLPNHVKAAPILDGIEDFDAEFFKYSRKEARMIDPQQRIFLETAWNAFEDAGYNPRTYAGRIGVYASAGMNSYLPNNLFANDAFMLGENGGKMLAVDSMGGFNLMITNDKDYMPTRVAYKLNLKGPSVNVQSACSSTLLGIHEAVKALQQGDCSMALAGGCSIKLPQYAGHHFMEGMLNSPDGHCRAYDAGAAGTIFGNGSGAVVLKRLEDAQADGDHIYAVIRGTGCANDGGEKVGYTAPSEQGEMNAVLEAVRRSGVSPDTITFVEGHGTGTPLGDPIEVEALTKAFRTGGTRTGYCALGSVKTNVGHLQIASGIVGFIKTVLALHHRKIPATLHYKTPNPRIDFGKSPFYVNGSTVPWNVPEGQPRRAGVNSLGIGGANVHIILEEAPAREAQVEAGSPACHVLPLSARNPKALAELAFAWERALTDELDVSAVAHTAQVGREHHLCRLAVTGSDVKSWVDKLAAWRGNGESVDCPEAPRVSPDGGIVFLFTGQGSQFPGAGKGLYQQYPLFREVMDTCNEILKAHLEVPLLDVLFADDKDLAARIHDTAYTQPALFALEYASARLWQSFGFEPAVLIGHSIGEYPAACLAGVFSLEDGLKLVAARGRLMQQLPREGGMLAVQVDEATALSWLKAAGDRVAVAGYNGERSLVLSGDKSQLDGVARLASEGGVRHKWLEVSHAFHSPLMEPMLEDFAKVVRSVSLEEPGIPMVSNVDGVLDIRVFADPEYWVRQIRSPVRYAQGIQSLVASKPSWFVEMGPQPVLCGLSKGYFPDDSTLWLPSMRGPEETAERFARSLAEAWEAGYPVNWEKGNTGLLKRRLPLPLYPWQRERLWIDPSPKADESDPGLSSSRPAKGALPGQRHRSPRQRETVYETTVGLDALPFLREHRVFDAWVVPGAMYVAQGLRIAEDELGTLPFELKDISFTAPLAVGREERRILQVVVGEADLKGHRPAEVLSFTEESAGSIWNVRTHANYSIAPASGKVTELDVEAFTQECGVVRDVVGHYAAMDAMKVSLGESFRWVGSLRSGQSKACGWLSAPKGVQPMEGVLHPGLVDSMLQVVMAAMPDTADRSFVPFRIDSWKCWKPLPGGRLRVLAQFTEESAHGRLSDLWIVDDSGSVCMEVRGFELREVSADAIRHALSDAAGQVLWEREWMPVDVPSGSTRMNGRWVIVSMRPGAGPVLEGKLARAGIEAERFVLDKNVCVDADSLERLFADWRVETADGVVWMPDGDPDAPDFVHLHGLYGLIRYLVDHQKDASPRVAVVADPGSSEVFNGPCQGVLGCLAWEQTGMRLLHFSGGRDLADTEEALAVWLRSGSDAQTVLWKDGRFHLPRLKPIPLVSHSPELRSDRTYLITGGMGDLGMATAGWMIERGARHLILAARSSPGLDSLSQIEKWRSEGFEVICADGTDVADRTCVDRLMALVPLERPLAGVVHAAGVLSDGLVHRMDCGQFDRVMASKALGAWNLHCAIGTMDLDFLVFFGSIASVVGSPSQSNYGAANAFLDALSVMRRAQGLSATTISWGPWAGIGMSARLNERQKQRLDEHGLGWLSAQTAFEVMDAALTQKPVHWVVAALDTTALQRHLPVGMRDLFGTAEVGMPETNGGSAKAQGLMEEISRLDPEAAVDRMLDHVRTVLAQVIGLDRPDEIEGGRGFFDLGLDSLMAVDVKNRLERTLCRPLRATLVFDHPTVESLARFLADAPVSDGNGNGSKPAQGVVASQASGKVTDRVEDADDIEALLAKELES